MMRATLFAGLVLLAAALGGAPVLASSVADDSGLAAYFGSVDTLRGEFEQVTRDETGQVVERARGHFAIQRPGRFSWVYETPYEQRIVADGDWLWVHDRDLRQVTVRPVEEVLGAGPALMLSGSLDDLEQRFEIRGGEGDWVTLRPRDDAWDFQSVRLRLRDGIPAVLQLKDGLGQVVRLELDALERNLDLANDAFETVVPEGADLIAPPEYPRG